MGRGTSIFLAPVLGTCALLVIVSDADKHGVQLMFVGTETYQTETPR